MGDRATLEKIYVILRRLLLVKLDGLNPIPRKGTTRRECYRALYEIQELLETRRYFGKHLPQTNADAQEVRHGEWWLLETPDDERTEYGQCSMCGDYFYLSHRVINSFKYCPNCGAKMDGEKDES